MKEAATAPLEKENTKETKKEDKSEDPHSNRTEGAEVVDENSKGQGNESPEEYGVPEQQELAIYEGPWTKEEQYHYDIMFNEMEWNNEPQKEPDTAGLVAAMLGADSFEMEIEE